MRWAGKVVGGVLGLFVGGPVGAAIGAALGHQYDAAQDEEASPSGGHLPPGQAAEQFFVSTFRIMGHVAKSDGRVSEREIAAARSIMAALRLDPMQVAVAIEEFSKGKEQSFDLAGEMANVRRALADRPDLARIFIEIQVRAALAGNNLEGPARKYVGRVASNLGISMIELAQIEAVLRIQRGNFRREAQQPAARSTLEIELAYKVLEVGSTAPNDEIVKAYRRQLSRHHPDKLKANGLPESMVEHAKERTQQIIEAYELIKERRGMS
ncbi:MAG TPA: co-chaperone DjlA [Steroidobacteraceae bacterium]